jgi:hypothetical protein
VLRTPASRGCALLACNFRLNLFLQDRYTMKVKTPKLIKFAVNNDSPTLKAIKRGSTVKVGIPGESFWVVVNSRKGNTFTGEVDNVLISTSLKLGDIIAFKTENVLDIHPEKMKESMRKLRRKIIQIT